MTIPDEAVEAAARAHWENGNSHSWADECGGVRADGMADMRAALEAAAPHMRQAFFLEMNLRAVQDELNTPLFGKAADGND